MVMKIDTVMWDSSVLGLRRGWGGRLVLMMALSIIGHSSPVRAEYQFRNAIDDPFRRQKSQVLEVYGDYAVRGMKVHQESLRLMINTGIRRLSGENDLRRAWRTYIHDQDVVALVFTPIGNRSLATNDALAGALLDSLEQAGFQRGQFMIVGLESWSASARGTRPWVYGWQKQSVDFGSGSDFLAQWLSEVTAIINVPSIMDDTIIHLRGALANLAWPLIKGPAQFYINHGDPFIPDIYHLPQIRGKVRLHIANTLRVLYYGGPVVQQCYLHEFASLLFSRDPVALDRVAIGRVNRARRERIMPGDVVEEIKAPYIETAYALGLGYCELNLIQVDRMRHEYEDATEPQNAQETTAPSTEESRPTNSEPTED